MVNPSVYNEDHLLCYLQWQPVMISRTTTCLGRNNNNEEPELNDVHETRAVRRGRLKEVDREFESMQMPHSLFEWRRVAWCEVDGEKRPPWDAWVIGIQRLRGMSRVRDMRS
eukprot:Gb_15704 [translate_table: standard]